MRTLRLAGYSTQALPDQQVSAFDIPGHLKVGTGVVLIGSPHNHDPDDRPTEGDQKGSGWRFKQNIFFSMCWNTPTDSAAIMTFSQSKCGKLEWWSVLQSYPTRIFMLVPAWFESYRPCVGLADDMSQLCWSDTIDTVVAIFAPASFMQALRWKGDQLNLADTIAAWLNNHHKRRLVSFGAYTAELELDIASAAPHYSKDQVNRGRRRHFSAPSRCRNNTTTRPAEA